MSKRILVETVEIEKGVEVLVYEKEDTADSIYCQKVMREYRRQQSSKRKARNQAPLQRRVQRNIRTFLHKSLNKVVNA